MALYCRTDRTPQRNHPACSIALDATSAGALERDPERLRGEHVRQKVAVDRLVMPIEQPRKRHRFGKRARHHLRIRRLDTRCRAAERCEIVTAPTSCPIALLTLTPSALAHPSQETSSLYERGHH